MVSWKNFMGSLTSSLGSMIGAVTSITMTIVTVPFRTLLYAKRRTKTFAKYKTHVT